MLSVALCWEGEQQKELPQPGNHGIIGEAGKGDQVIPALCPTLALPVKDRSLGINPPSVFRE